MSFRGFMAVMLLATLAACANPNGGGEDKMSMGYLNQHLIPNKTSKADVVQMFGQPRYKDEQRDGADYWSYTEAQINGTDYVGEATKYLSGLGGSLTSAAAATQAKKPTRDLAIYFNTNGTVRNFHAAGSTGAGS
jgi:outer membrane protein assembly factor BamE (lipoprotein component of BamABCDE complex)